MPCVCIDALCDTSTAHCWTPACLHTRTGPWPCPHPQAPSPARQHTGAAQNSGAQPLSSVRDRAPRGCQGSSPVSASAVAPPAVLSSIQLRAPRRCLLALLPCPSPCTPLLISMSVARNAGRVAQSRGRARRPERYTRAPCKHACQTRGSDHQHKTNACRHAAAPSHPPSSSTPVGPTVLMSPARKELLLPARQRVPPSPARLLRSSSC